MGTNKLNDAALRNAKPKDTTYTLSDGDGMYLEVTPRGGKWWRFKYRFDGKQKRFSLGTYPDTSLKQARDKRLQARELLASGTDPGDKRRSDKLAAATVKSNTFAGVAEEWATNKVLSEKWTATTEKKRRGWLENGLLRYLGERPVAKVTTPELWKVLQQTQASSGYTANRLRGMAVEIFNYAIATGRAESNPALPLQGQIAVKKERHRLAILDPEKIGKLLKDIDNCQVTPAIKAAARLAPLLFVRPGELRHAEWSEIDFSKAEWNIPAKKMKMREPHVVPLSRQAVDILKELQIHTGKSRYVFEGAKRGNPFSDNTLNKLLKTLGYEGQMTQHGWRAIARTLLDEGLNFRVDWIEHQLAHSVRDANGRAYNRTSHLEGRIEMMQAWADYLEALMTGKKYSSPNVATETRHADKKTTQETPNDTKPKDIGDKNFNAVIERYLARRR